MTYTRTFTVKQGDGKINVYKNGVLQGTATPTVPYTLSTLELNDTYKWISIPNPGYLFEKWCFEDKMTCENTPDKQSYISDTARTTRPIGVYFTNTSTSQYTRTFTVKQGSGKIDVYKNGIFQGTAITTLPYTISNLTLNDTYRWISTPDIGYSFEKWCWEDKMICENTLDKQSYISDTARITRPIGVYFTKCLLSICNFEVLSTT